MPCRFCDQHKTLVRAHIIPKGFFRRLRDGQNAPQLLSNVENAFPKRAPIGVYDAEILCGDCESRFGDWDQYAQELLAESPASSVKLHHNGQVAAWEVAKYDYDKLKLFFVSLLWRASVSVQSFYGRVRLGQHEAQAKELIVNQEPGSPDDFAVTLSKFDHILGETILDPHPEKWEGVNYYRFYLGGYVAYIKADKRPAPHPLADFALSPAGPLRIIARHLERSKELPLIKDIMAP